MGGVECTRRPRVTTTGKKESVSEIRFVDILSAKKFKHFTLYPSSIAMVTGNHSQLDLAVEQLEIALDVFLDGISALS